MVPLIVLSATLVMASVERVWPGRAFPQVRGFFSRAAIVSFVQALVVVLFGHSFDAWLLRHRVFTFAVQNDLVAVLFGYVTVTFVFYVWHRLRHENRFLWRFVHQFHHSPQRIEVVTSFYKHPLEIVLNACLTATTLYLVCGLNMRQASFALALCGLGELFYHWNVRTPRWVGCFIQRPEMHCEHHREGVHRHNYGDLPIWDRLFGTYFNPKAFDGRCGFGEDEHRVAELLTGKELSP